MAQVSRKDAQAVADTISANIVMEVSAKTGYNIEKLFTDVAKKLIERDSSVSILYLVFNFLLPN